MPEADLEEAEALERIADWRIAQGGAVSRAAAKLLQRLADDLRRDPASPALAEYRAICGWLDEYDGMADFAEQAQLYRTGIGIEHFPDDGEAYLRVLIGLAKATFGA
jgi:hypothetical protein